MLGTIRNYLRGRVTNPSAVVKNARNLLTRSSVVYDQHEKINRRQRFDPIYLLSSEASKDVLIYERDDDLSELLIQMFPPVRAIAMTDNDRLHAMVVREFSGIHAVYHAISDDDGDSWVLTLVAAFGATPFPGNSASMVRRKDSSNKVLFIMSGFESSPQEYVVRTRERDGSEGAFEGSGNVPFGFDYDSSSGTTQLVDVWAAVDGSGYHLVMAGRARCLPGGVGHTYAVRYAKVNPPSQTIAEENIEDIGLCKINDGEFPAWERARFITPAVVEANGIAHVFYIRQDSDTGVLEIRHSRRTGGTWSTPETLVSSVSLTGEYAVAPDVADVRLTWVYLDGSTRKLKSRVWDGASLTWGSELAVGTYSGVHLALDTKGVVLLGSTDIKSGTHPTFADVLDLVADETNIRLQNPIPEEVNSERWTMYYRFDVNNLEVRARKQSI